MSGKLLRGRVENYPKTENIQFQPFQNFPGGATAYLGSSTAYLGGATAYMVD